MQLKRGNNATLQFIVKDSAGTVITNLASATAVQFVLKNNKSDADSAAIILKNLTNGITVNNPNIGNITVVLTSTDMNIGAKNYFLALRITYSSTEVQEVNIRNTDIADINFLDSVAVVEYINHV